MKIIAVAAFALTAVSFLPAAQAQRVPQGSYLRSCTDVAVRGDTLVAVCHARDGRDRRTSLADVSRCVGDIGNNNGNLACAYGNGAAPPRTAGPAPTPEPRYGEPRREEPQYGEPRRDEPRSGERRERCEGVHREVEELRGRMAREFNPIDRARMDGQLHELQDQEARCRR